MFSEQLWTLSNHTRAVIQAGRRPCACAEAAACLRLRQLSHGSLETQYGERIFTLYLNSPILEQRDAVPRKYASSAAVGAK
jgi:hypothetical protein